MGRYGNSNMGTEKNNHTDPICFSCFESDFRWYFQLTFLKIKKHVGKIKKTFFTSMIVTSSIRSLFYDARPGRMYHIGFPERGPSEELKSLSAVHSRLGVPAV